MTAFSERVKKVQKFFTNLLTETSPFDSLYEHADSVQETVEALADDIHHYTKGKPVKDKRVSEFEFEADSTKQEIRRDLPRSDLLMPVARSDLLSLLWNQDEIADNSQDVAELLPMLELKAEPPEEYRESLDQLAETLKASVEEYGELIRSAGEIIEGTSSNVDNLGVVLDSIEDINRLEHEADKKTRRAIKSVYRSETLEDIEKYHLIQIALKINNTLDHVENASNFIRIMTNK